MKVSTQEYSRKNYITDVSTRKISRYPKLFEILQTTIHVSLQTAREVELIVRFTTTTFNGRHLPTLTVVIRFGRHLPNLTVMM
jgi:hypothetical protein